MDGGYTMKYLRKNSDGYFLEPANKTMSPMYPEGELSIVATVRGVVRKY